MKEWTLEWPLASSVLLLVIGAGLAFLSTIYWTGRAESAARHKTYLDDNVSRDRRLVDLEKQLALVGAAVVPIATAFQAILIKELTHFHTPEMDLLLTKIGPPASLTEIEFARLIELLAQREIDLGDMISPSERDAARMLPMIMRRAIMEYDAPMYKTAMIQAVVLPKEVLEILPTGNGGHSL